MNILPWRVRRVVSDNFPLVYHLTVNLFRRNSGADYWDQNLSEWWQHDVRRWPTKAKLISERSALNADVLDIACGNGSIMKDLRTLGFTSLAGLEISKFAVQKLREEGFRMFQGELPMMPVPDAEFDVVVASQVLEHIIRRDRFAKEIVRVMRPGAQGFIFVPHDCLGPIDEPEHVIKYNRDSFRKFLEKHFDSVAVDVIKDANFPMEVLFGHVRKPQSAGPSR